MSLSGMVEIAACEKEMYVMPANAGIQVTDSVRHTPGFHRGDKNRLDSGFRQNDGNGIDFQSTNSGPFGLQPGRSVVAEQLSEFLVDVSDSQSF